jgi:hypothetical protein
MLLFSVLLSVALSTEQNILRGSHAAAPTVKRWPAVDSGESVYGSYMPSPAPSRGLFGLGSTKLGIIGGGAACVLFGLVWFACCRKEGNHGCSSDDGTTLLQDDHLRTKLVAQRKAERGGGVFCCCRKKKGSGGSTASPSPSRRSNGGGLSRLRSTSVESEFNPWSLDPNASMRGHNRDSQLSSGSVLIASGRCVFRAVHITDTSWTFRTHARDRSLPTALTGH